MATIRETMEQVAETRDAKLAGKVADTLRFKAKLSYNQIVEYVKKFGISAEDWEQMMYEADMNHE